MFNIRRVVQKLLYPCRQAYALSPLFVMSLTGCAGAANYSANKYSEEQYISLARTVFEYTNSLRVDPSRYANILKSNRNRFSGKIYYPNNEKIGVKTREGLKAVDEAISALNQQQAVKPLAWSDELAELAKRHVFDTGAKGLLGHGASNGDGFSQRVSGLMKKGKFSGISENISYGWSSGKEVVVQLVVDDGIPGRGHRKNILKKASRYTGVSCGYHQQYMVMCVALYAR